MFLKKYIDKLYFDLIINTYERDFINNLNEENFIDIYNIFKKYNFYFIDDIILKYLEIFITDKNILEQKILKLKEILGDKFVYIIGNNMNYLNYLL